MSTKPRLSPHSSSALMKGSEHQRSSSADDLSAVDPPDDDGVHIPPSAYSHARQLHSLERARKRATPGCFARFLTRAHDAFLDCFCWPCRRGTDLPGVLTTTDHLQFNCLVKTLDAVGAPEVGDYDPKTYPKNVWGATLSTLLRLVVLVLIVWYCIQLFAFTTTVNQGLRMQINPLAAGAGQQLDVPTLEFALSSSIAFYEAQSTSLQRVDVEDMTGYNPNLASITDKVPLASAFYQAASVNLNSFDANLQTVAPDDPNTVALSMSEQTYSVSMHSFKETMKVLYEKAQVYPTVQSFFNHTVTLYVRIPQTTLAVLKTCQTQLQLYNSAVYDALYNASVLEDRTYHSPTTFPGLVTHDLLWSPSDFSPVKGKATLLQLNSPGWTLVRLQSRMTEDLLQAFASSTSWGSQQADLSSYFNLSAEGLTAQEGIMTPLSFLDWRVAFSYVNNMMYLHADLACDGDSSNFDLSYATSFHPINATATTLRIDQWEYDADVLGDFDPQWLPVVVLVIGAQGQEEMTVTDARVVDNATVLTVVRGADPVDFTGAPEEFDCYTINFPTSVSLLPPGAWTCDVAAYWANDRCDCGCGVPDPDCCFMYAAPVVNCAPGQMCSPAGTCVNQYITNGTVLSISESCYVISKPGDMAIAGYVGDVADFNTAGGGQCVPCPGDLLLYEGMAQLDSNTGLYTCNVATQGDLSGRNIHLVNPDPQPDVGVNWEVFVHKNTHFPTQGFPYPVSVGVDVGGGETVYVYAASDVSTSPNNRSLQLLTVATLAGSTNFQTRVSVGKLVSALTSTSNLPVVIRHPLDASALSFSTAGPYSIRAAETALVVTDASIATNRPYQVLRLRTPPAADVGYVTYLQQPAQVGATQVRVAPFTWYWDSLVGTDSTGYRPYPYPSTVPILMRGSQDYSGLEYIAQGDVSAPPTWTCPTAYFHAGDGCDCNCGLFDPDCAVDNRTLYDSSAACARNSSCQPSTACSYCAWVNGTNGYATGQCVDTPPSNPWPIPAADDSSTYYQLISLSSPLKLFHDVGYGVETPVTLDATPMDWYNASVGYYDVYTYATIQLSRTSTAFTPDDRYNSHPPEMTTSPASIPFEAAMFLIPDRAAFNDTPLCPTIPTINSVQPLEAQLRSVQPARRMYVQGCSGAEVTADTIASTCVTVASQEALQDYNRFCIVEMPPTYTFDFTTVMPVNNKWQMNHSQDSGIDEASYAFDFQLVYYFGRDDDFVAAENQFAAGQSPGGDIDRSGDAFVFYGQLDEAGPSAASTSAADGTALPATTPIVNVALTLRPSQLFALADLQRLKPLNWPTDATEQQALIDSFPALNLMWDLDVVDGSTAMQQVPLLPGYAYFLTAEVEIVTRYRADVLGRTSISSWTLQTTASSVSLVPLEYFSRQKAVLRYKLTLRDNSYQQLEVYVTPLSTFFGQVGGALAYLAYAVTAVAVVHQLTRWNQRQDLYKQAQVKLEREKEDKAKTDSLVELVLRRAHLEPQPPAEAAGERPSARGAKIAPAPHPAQLFGRVDDASSPV